MTTTEVENKFKCPKCHSDNIQSYPVTFQSNAGTVTTNTVGAGIAGKFGVGAAHSVGTHINGIAEIVAPPLKRGYFYKILLSLFIAFIVETTANSFSGTAGRVSGWLVLVVALYFLVYRYTYLWNRDVYPKLCTTWQHSYICMKCGNSFLIND